MDAAQWPKVSLYDFHKEIGLINNPAQGSGDLAVSDPSSSHSKQEKNKKTKLDKDQKLNCPRCNSTNTKFCYYNNYNPSQPRHLCKACRRYWTHGGTLRNVPVGGSSRKKNKSSSFAPSQLNSSRLFLDLNPKPSNLLAPLLNPMRSLLMHENQDLSMGLYYANAHHHFLPMSSPFEPSASHGALSPYNVLMSSSPAAMSEANNNARLSYPSSGFHFQDIIKPTLNLSMDGGFGSSTHDMNTNMEAGAGRIPFPFGGMKQVSATSSADNVSDQTNGQTRNSSNGVLYWNNNGHGLYN